MKATESPGVKPDSSGVFGAAAALQQRLQRNDHNRNAQDAGQVLRKRGDFAWLKNVMKE